MSLISSDFNFSQLIVEARRYGLPVKVLEAANDRYLKKFGSGDYVMPKLNVMVLKKDILEWVKGLDADGRIGENFGLPTVYHEATHAFMDVHSDDEDLQQVRRQAEEYYRGAPLADGSKADNPARITDEAAGTYVGDIRVFNYWSTLEKLASWLERRPHDENQLREIIQAYNQSALDRVCGYQDVGYFWWKQQQETTMPICPALKKYCDDVVLESKIPPSFAQAPYLNWVLQREGIVVPKL